MDKHRVVRIRPMSWKVYVQGRGAAEYLRERLREWSLGASEPEREPDLVEPSIYSFQVGFTQRTPLTQAELRAILERDERVEMGFEPHE